MRRQVRLPVYEHMELERDASARAILMEPGPAHASPGLGIHLTAVALIWCAPLAAIATLAPENGAWADLKQLSGASETFRVEHKRYPTQAEGIEILSSGPGAYLPRLPRDLWGRGYVYIYPGKHNPKAFDLYCLGEDGKSSTGGADADDINSWDKTAPW